jgi:uncharacterized protein (TIGR02996 family)
MYASARSAPCAAYLRPSQRPRYATWRNRRVTFLRLGNKTSIRRLEPRFLEPDRSRLGEVRALLGGITDAAEAWAKVGFTSEMPRWFRGKGALLPHPPTVEACALLACDREGVLCAEELARAARSRLARWRGDVEERDPKLIWRIQGAARAADHDGPTIFDVPGLDSAAMVAIRLARWSPPEDRPEKRFRSAALVATAADAWREAASRRGVIRGAVSEMLPVSETLLGTSIDELPDPFDPLHRLYLLGYGVRRIDANEIALFAPGPPRPEVIGRRQWRAVTDGSAKELRRAVFEADLETIAELLEDGVDPNLTTAGGETAVHVAVRSRAENSPQALRLLANGKIGCAARLDLADDQGLAPIHLAALLGRKDKIRGLVELGVSVDAKSIDGRRALHLAVEGGHEEAVKLLLALGASPDEPDSGGRSPLHCLSARISRPRPGLYRRLLEAGANPDARARSGWTALHEVAGARWGGAREREMLLDLLIDAGAKQHRELSGATPADLARYRKDVETADRLAVVPLIEADRPIGDPRNDVLERAIWSNPNDRDAWLVYADWLQSQGDPRGEIIATDIAYETARGVERARLKKERDRLYDMYAPYLSAGLEPLRSAWIIASAPAERWRRGFLDSLATYDSPAPLMAAAPRVPACRFLRTLAVDVVSDARRFVEAMLEVDRWPSLRTLRFSGMWRPFVGAHQLVERLPHLEALDLEGPAVRDLELAWPGLQRLRLRPARFPGIAPTGLRLRLDLPQLSLLDVDVRTQEEIDGLRALLENPPPKLAVLRLVRSTPEVIDAIAQRLPKTIASLEVVRPNLGALAELERHAAAIEHLRVRVDITGDRTMVAPRLRRLEQRLPLLRFGR